MGEKNCFHCGAGDHYNKDCPIKKPIMEISEKTRQQVRDVCSFALAVLHGGSPDTMSHADRKKIKDMTEELEQTVGPNPINVPTAASVSPTK